ncbi:MAG: UPF0489 family protein [Sedimentisphaerales bacterium]|nr:UPF0489 family protein [Sedimentisphaerales bacterium]
MSVILDIDLDYFRCSDEPLKRLNELLAWANRPVDSVFTNHHEALAFWAKAVKDGVIDTPRFILHVDEHHDMLSDRPPINAGNFLYFAMRRWPKCRVHWLVDRRIDSPKQWLPEEDWKAITRRFTSGKRLRPSWPTPDIVTMCTSPGFISKALRKRLLGVVAKAAPETRKRIGLTSEVLRYG